MSDYGHALLFGTFVTPTNSPVAQAVELSVVADRAGLDLVTFQDHPYVARFHDAPTLMSYAAARTERVHLALNVTNLPLRPPAVLARTVASLDLISGGRVRVSARAAASVGRGTRRRRAGLRHQRVHPRLRRHRKHRAFRRRGCARCAGAGRGGAVTAVAQPASTKRGLVEAVGRCTANTLNPTASSMVNRSSAGAQHERERADEVERGVGRVVDR